MFEALRSPAVSDEKHSDRIVAVFARCFAEAENTLLVGGADEPYYQPANTAGEKNRLYFREDFARSALHEASHWCVAGPERRRLPDFGYWYEADGRDARQQRQFEAVEVRPQALEYIFCRAAGLRFQVSIDNLDGGESDPFPFQLAVWQQVRRHLRFGLSARAAQFRQALAEEFGQQNGFAAESFSLAELRGR